MASPPNRDLPEVVSELVIEMHEVRSELQSINGRLNRLAQTMGQAVEELQKRLERISTAVLKPLEPLLTRIPDNSDQLKSRYTRFNRLENPQA